MKVTALAFLLWGATSAIAYDQATVDACQQIPAKELTPDTYYRCCCARCDCAYETCETQCRTGRDKLSEIRDAERRRDNRNTFPRTSP